MSNMVDKKTLTALGIYAGRRIIIITDSIVWVSMMENEMDRQINRKDWYPTFAKRKPIL